MKLAGFIGTTCRTHKTYHNHNTSDILRRNPLITLCQIVQR